MNELGNLPWALIAPLLVIQFILMIVAIIDIARSHATNGPKWVWIIVSIIGGMLGPIIYFLVGRKNG
jgi:membrane protein DedA with SNARE-associated domain